MAELTHFNQAGDARMVDIGDKASTRRIATASGRITMAEATLALINQGQHQKGDVLAVARIAAIMAAKRASSLIPLCHPLALTAISIDFVVPEDSAIVCTAQVETCGQTGVEMEALTAVQVALLTIYDMCKAVDRAMVMTDIALLQKSGGSSGDWAR